MVGCFFLLMLFVTLIGCLQSFAEHRIKKSESAAAIVSAVLSSINIAVWICEISLMGGVAAFFSDLPNLEHVAHPSLLIIALAVVIFCSSNGFAGWFSLASIESIIVLFMGMTYYGTGKFLLSVLLALLGFCIGSVFSAIFGERIKKKRVKDDLRELLVKSYVEFKMKEMEKEKEKEKEI